MVDRDARRRRWKVNRGRCRGDGTDGSFLLPVRYINSLFYCPFAPHSSGLWRSYNPSIVKDALYPLVNLR